MWYRYGRKRWGKIILLDWHRSVCLPGCIKVLNDYFLTGLTHEIDCMLDVIYRLFSSYSRLVPFTLPVMTRLRVVKVITIRERGFFIVTES